MYCFILFSPLFLIEILVGKPDQTTRSAASDLGRHCLRRSQKNGRQANMGCNITV